MKITTENGFECTINEDSLQDPVLFRDMVKLQKGDVARLVDVVEGILGETGWDDLIAFAEKKNGKAKVPDMVEEFYAAMKMAGESKKK